ncbi:DUF3306 domain-containing protein [Shewanella youngdeokensis]|uniref:DUF3306 domain-containing protein n=1 Tax=Shewanella youngdeokensis TaxID=2999068 RepID=A0ABZ0JYF7_9GAMM|nr:DUF3306 domain-containing protein [Shewanella sp. DAU334]
MSGLLSRWNLRRQKVSEETETEVTATEAEQTSPEAETLVSSEVAPATGAEGVATQAAPEEGKLLTAADLPDPEKIEVGGSFASFMGANVDPAAKSAALKALWKQPHYNELDGLLDYALDYTNQPKLSAEVSSELAKKVFRYVVEDDDEKEGDATSALESDEVASAAPALDAASDAAESDILGDDNAALSQNEPQHQDITNNKVV